MLVFSSSEADQDIHDAYRGHANGYITKPSSIDVLAEVVEGIERFWIAIAQLPKGPTLSRLTGNERATCKTSVEKITDRRRNSMFIALCAILFIAWLIGLTAFHVAGGLIHLLLVFAVISLVIHFVRGRSAV